MGLQSTILELQICSVTSIMEGPHNGLLNYNPRRSGLLIVLLCPNGTLFMLLTVHPCAAAPPTQLRTRANCFALQKGDRPINFVRLCKFCFTNCKVHIIKVNLEFKLHSQIIDLITLGNGGKVHKLSIPRANAIPNCGTEYYGSTQTNIVVVQHSEIVQTSKDMIYNLTCTLQPPGESVVSSGYIGAG